MPASTFDLAWFWRSRSALLATFVVAFTAFSVIDALTLGNRAAERTIFMMNSVVNAFLVFGWASTDLRTRKVVFSTGRVVAILFLGPMYVPFHLFRFRERGQRWRPMLYGLLAAVVAVALSIGIYAFVGDGTM